MKDRLLSQRKKSKEENIRERTGKEKQEKTQICTLKMNFLIVRVWANYLDSLYLGFLICKIG